MGRLKETTCVNDSTAPVWVQLSRRVSASAGGDGLQNAEPALVGGARAQFAPDASAMVAVMPVAPKTSVTPLPLGAMPVTHCWLSDGAADAGPVRQTTTVRAASSPTRA